MITCLRNAAARALLILAMNVVAERSYGDRLYAAWDKGITTLEVERDTPFTLGP